MDDYGCEKHYLLNHFSSIFVQHATNDSVSKTPVLHIQDVPTVEDTSPRQAQGNIGDSCVKWKHFLSDVSDVAAQTGTVRGRIHKDAMSLRPGFHMIVTVIVSICRRLIRDTSPMMCRSRSPNVMIIAE